ncbi:hypothetical protein NQ317_000222 [Molorchus minor]|uniref:PPM-type phosphatase domain-containing protein n=1 Tax=Molorchus minor TaxID=1323400 RepID=A0ABQ9J917_9CUCU|nr:hypothetical protein NQ317_000222 [Molorchus minor]
MRSLPEMVSGEDKSGTTAVCAFVSPRTIYIANCGDSRAVLCREGVPVFSTQDHKPGLPTERERIVKAGGSVMIQRVNGSLAVSRALGDYEYKNVEGRGPCDQLVSPEPEIFVKERDDMTDEFLVLACDGIWDVMSNEDLCAYIHHQLLVTDNLQEVTRQVIDTCLYKETKELDATIRRHLKEIIEQGEEIEYRQILRKLLSMNLEGLPPGGGIASNFGHLKKLAHATEIDILPLEDSFQSLHKQETQDTQPLPECQLFLGKNRTLTIKPVKDERLDREPPDALIGWRPSLATPSIQVSQGVFFKLICITKGTPSNLRHRFMTASEETKA